MKLSEISLLLLDCKEYLDDLHYEAFVEGADERASALSQLSENIIKARSAIEIKNVELD